MPLGNSGVNKCCNSMRSLVSVPVLSNTTASTRASDSKDCTSRSNTPWRARLPAAASMAAGVANDKAQGQVTINTDTATIMALPGDSPQAQTAASAATTSTASKNGLAMRSASAASRGLCNEAVCIKFTIAA